VPPQPDPSIKALVEKTIADAKRLANAQAALAKTELGSSGQNAGMGAGLGVATAIIAGFATLFLLVTLALGLVQMGLMPWLAFLIVAVLLLIIGTVTGLLARKKIEEAKPPNLAMAEFEKTKAILSGKPLPDSLEAKDGNAVDAVSDAASSAAAKADEVMDPQAVADAKAAFTSPSNGL
jgi:Flp pilus assembly protein TadB